MSQHHDLKGPYLAIFGVLTIGTIATMAVAQLMENSNPLINILIAVAIAAIKATCVLAIFMHIKYDEKVLRVAICFPLALLGVFILGNTPDTAIGMAQDRLLVKPLKLEHPFHPGAKEGEGEHAPASSGDDDDAAPKKKSSDDDDP
jgi:caa(3)-type oxidase subunit IV